MKTFNIRFWLYAFDFGVCRERQKKKKINRKNNQNIQH